MENNQDTHIDKTVRIMLIVAIAAWAFQLLYPLLGILAWGFILAVVLYPLYTWLNTRLGHRPLLAATLLVFCALLLIISITIYVTNDVTQSISDFSTRIRTQESILSTPPTVIKTWPIIGNSLYQTWLSASTNLESVLTKYSSTLLSTGKYALTKLLNTSKDLLLFIISLLFSGFLMVHAANFMTLIRQFAKRVANDRGIHMINIVRETIQNVSRGIIGISLLQTLIFGLLILIAKVPCVGLLSLLALILSIIQIGLLILIIPIIVWLFFTKSILFAAIITCFLILDMLLDGFLKPVVLARGLHTPMMIIFIGVIGGMLVYGVIGIFIGPVVLAIAYDLMRQWLEVESH